MTQKECFSFLSNQLLIVMPAEPAVILDTNAVTIASQKVCSADQTTSGTVHQASAGILLFKLLHAG
jgi:hypothetical protein